MKYLKDYKLYELTFKMYEPDKRYYVVDINGDTVYEGEEDECGNWIENNNLKNHLVLDYNNPDDGMNAWQRKQNRTDVERSSDHTNRKMSYQFISSRRP